MFGAIIQVWNGGKYGEQKIIHVKLHITVSLLVFYRIDI